MSLSGYDKADLEGLVLVESYRKMKIYSDEDMTYTIVYRAKEIDSGFNHIDYAREAVDHYFMA